MSMDDILLEDTFRGIFSQIKTLRRIVNRLRSCARRDNKGTPHPNCGECKEPTGRKAQSASIELARQLSADLTELLSAQAAVSAAWHGVAARSVDTAHFGAKALGAMAGPAAVPRKPTTMSWATLVVTGSLVPDPSHIGGAPPAPQLVNITGGHSLKAVVLPATMRTAHEIYAVLVPGEIYYIPHWDHFAVRIGPCVLHANIGQVYSRIGAAAADPSARVLPERIKECRRPDCQGGRECRYYHDPEKFPDSANVRNFMAESWHYVPPVVSAGYGVRRFGSAEHLGADLGCISVRDARQFLAQTAHDLLCSLILWKYVISPTPSLPDQPRAQTPVAHRKC